MSTTEMPVMPPDFWPDELTVVGKYKGAELGFALTARGQLEGIESTVDTLRMALWQAVQMQSASIDDPDFATLKRTLTGAR